MNYWQPERNRRTAHEEEEDKKKKANLSNYHLFGALVEKIRREEAKEERKCE